MKHSSILSVLVVLASLSNMACDQLAPPGSSQGHSSAPETGGSKHEDEHEHAEGHHQHRIIVTRPVAQDVNSTHNYVCQIRSCRHIELRALENGYLEEIPVKEGQTVQQGDTVFKVLPTLYQARLEAEQAEAALVQLEYNNAKRLMQQNVVSPQEVAIAEAKLAKATAKVKLSQAELNFATVTAPFTGIIDRLLCQKGSLVAEGDVLTTLSDNSVMWVYFNVPEARYLEYKSQLDLNDPNLQVQLMLADHSKFPHPGKIGAIEADFNVETGNIAFRADFPNPDRLLRNGQTGKILILRTIKDAIVIPQRASFEILAERYVYVVDEEGVVQQRRIEIGLELEDLFVVKRGIELGDKIIFEGIRQVRDGDKIEYDFRQPDEILSQLKNQAQ
jgi:membrane fusion protein (multidrug efflux system)